MTGVWARTTRVIVVLVLVTSVAIVVSAGIVTAADIAESPATAPLDRSAKLDREPKPDPTAVKLGADVVLPGSAFHRPPSPSEMTSRAVEAMDYAVKNKKCVRIYKRDDGMWDLDRTYSPGEKIPDVVGPTR